MPNPALEKVEKQFVCVRVIKTQGLDLDLFQYDYDMSWSAMFLNAADMAVYGRYGTRYSSGHDSDANLSPKAFQLLTLLVESRPKALSKDTLYNVLWPDMFVVEANLSNLVGEVRAALLPAPLVA